jgi:hypothetical protein
MGNFQSVMDSLSESDWVPNLICLNFQQLRWKTTCFTLGAVQLRLHCPQTKLYIINKQINQSCLLKLPCRDEQPHVGRSIDSSSRFTAIKNELSRRSARILCFYWQLEEHLISSVRSNQDTTPADLFEGFNQSYGQWIPVGWWSAKMRETYTVLQDEHSLILGRVLSIPTTR